MSYTGTLLSGVKLYTQKELKRVKEKHSDGQI